MKLKLRTESPSKFLNVVADENIFWVPGMDYVSINNPNPNLTEEEKLFIRRAIHINRLENLDV